MDFFKISMPYLLRSLAYQTLARWYAWRDWFASRGMQVDGDMSGPRFELFSMQTEAAIQGMGIALIPRLLIEDELRRRTLIPVVEHDYLSDRSYYLIYPEQKSDSATAIARLIGPRGAAFSLPRSRCSPFFVAASDEREDSPPEADSRRERLMCRSVRCACATRERRLQTSPK